MEQGAESSEDTTSYNWAISEQDAHEAQLCGQRRALERRVEGDAATAEEEDRGAGQERSAWEIHELGRSSRERLGGI